MLEVKELVNVTSKENFISYKYLREKAIYSLNTDAFEIMQSVRTNCPLEEMNFNFLNGSISTCQLLGIISVDELRKFMDLLIHCKHCKECIGELKAPFMEYDGTVILKKYL